MMAISLLPISKKGKQLVRQHGDRWLVIDKKDSVLFSTDAGPWLLVVPITEDQAPAQDLRAARIESACRWLHQYNNQDFKIAP